MNDSSAALITLQRRHGPGCSAGHPQGSYSFETDERRRNAKTCSCRIYACGTLNGVYQRLATRQRDWSRAKEILAPYLAAGRWDITPPDAPPPAPPPSGSAALAETPASAGAGMPIASAVKACLREQENSGAARNTIRKYQVVLAKFERFSQTLGLRWLEEWRPSHVRQFRDSWGVSPLTAGKNLGVVKAFFEIFVEDEILERNPARIRCRQNRALRTGGETGSAGQKNPFTNEELARMLDGCRSLGRTDIREWPKKRGGRQVVPITRYRDYRRKWTGEDLADFIQLSYFTGLRISDVAAFDISRLTSAGVKLRATKNGAWVSVPVPEFLRNRIRARAARFGPRIFGEHATSDLNVVADVWRRKLIRLWDETGPWAEKPVHHRFRHTFVRLLLENGTPLSVIAELTGDTEQMIRRHYSAWMPGRQENVNRILDEAFRNVPRFHAL